MIGVVVDPDADRFAALLLGIEGVGVEAFLGKDPLIAFDFSGSSELNVGVPVVRGSWR